MRSGVLAALAVVVACSKAAAPPPVPAVRPPTRLQVDTFATTFATAMRTCDSPQTFALFDEELFVARVGTHQGLWRVKRGELVAAVEGSARSRLCHSLDVGTAYVRTTDRDVEGAIHPVFRIEGRKRGYDYHELELTVGHDGAVRIADVVVYSLGGTLSSLVGDTLGWSRRPRLTDAANRVLTAKGTEELRRAHAALPAELRRARQFKLYAIVAAVEHPDGFTAAVMKYREEYPDDPAADLMATDYYNPKRDYRRLLEAVERLERRLDGDPYLLLLRSIAVGELGDIEGSLREAERAAAGAPQLLEPAKNLVWMRLGRGEYGDAVRALERARQHVPEFDESELSSVRTWTEFSASPEYAAWKAALARGTPNPTPP